MAGHISRRHRASCAKRKDRRKRCNCDGPWRVRLPDPARGGSAQIERRFPAGAKREAEAWKATQEHALQTGGWIDPRRAERPFGDVADAWKATWRDLEPKTKAGYESILTTHLLPEFGKRKVSTITPEVVEAYLNRLAEEGTKPGTIRNIFAALRTALNTGVRLRMIASNPCLGVKPPRIRRQPMLFLTAAEVRSLAESIDPRYRTLLYVAAYCGLRAGELLALRRVDVDLLRGTIHVRRALKEVNGRLHFGPTKTHAERTVTLPRFLRTMLVEHLESVEDVAPDALIFPGSRGGPMRHGHFYRAHFRPAVGRALRPEKAGLRFHDLRHTSVSLLIAEGAHPKLIATRLGHSSVQITLDRYGHLFPSVEEALAEKLDAAFEAAQLPATNVVPIAAGEEGR